MGLKYLKIINISLATLLAVSCGSVPVSETSDIVQTEKEEIRFTEEETAFIEKMNNISISVVNTPKETSVNKAFTSDFSVKFLLNDGTPVSDFPVKVTFINNEGTEDYKIINTDENGLCAFKPEVPAHGLNDFIGFEPYFESDKQEVIDVCTQNKVLIPCKVKGRLFEKGALLFVWDYNEKDRPVNNSYDILSEIRNRGIWMAGNAPVSETYYFDRPISEVYAKNKEIVGNAYGFLILGQIKFTKPVEKVEDEYLCSLVAEINVIDMSNGDVAFTKTFANEALGSNWTKCVTKCKKELAGKIVDSIIYDIRL